MISVRAPNSGCIGARDEASHHRVRRRRVLEDPRAEIVRRDVADLPGGLGQRDARAAADGHVVEAAPFSKRQPPAVARDRADRIAIANHALLLGGIGIRDPNGPGIDVGRGPRPDHRTDASGHDPRGGWRVAGQSARRSSSHGVLV